MTHRKPGIIGGFVVGVFAAAAGIVTIQAQQAQPVKRHIALKQDMAIAGKEAVMAHVELPPGAAEGRHTHPAEVFVFVEQGTISFFIEGKGTATYKAGDVFSVPRDTVHEGTNQTSEPVKLDVVFIADKGKPLTAQVQ